MYHFFPYDEPFLSKLVKLDSELHVNLGVIYYTDSDKNKNRPINFSVDS
jgi:hypothetical protein